MKKDDDLKWTGGSDDFELISKGDKLFKDKLNNIGLQFFLNVVESAQTYTDKETGKVGLVDTGAMTNEKNYKAKIIQSGSTSEIELYMLFYSRFIDQGVQGVFDNTNAPNSPYKFKTLGMPEKVRKKFINYVKRNKQRITDTTKTGSGKIGLEVKASDRPNKKDINEKEADQLIYLIKAFGIKETKFIRNAWKKTIKDVDPQLREAALQRLKFIFLKSNT